MKALLELKQMYYLTLFMLFYAIISVIHNHIFVSETLLSQWYEGILTQTQIQEAISFSKKWEWGIVALNILLILIRMGCVTACLYLGLFFFSNQNNIYKISVNVALKAEIIFVVYCIVRLFWYKFIYMPESAEEMQVMPLSLMVFFDPLSIEPWLIYPLNTLNIFEVLYFFLLAGLTTVAVKIKFRKAFELVFVSYGAGLLLLMVAQMFLILNNS